MANMFVALNSFANCLGSTPYRANPRKGKLYVHFWSHFRCLHFSIWTLTYGIVVLPTHLFFLYTIRDTSKICFVIVTMHAAIGCSIFTGIFALRSLGVCQFLNGMFKYLQDFKEKYIGNITKEDKIYLKIFEALLLGIIIISLSIGLFAAIDCCMRPHASTYLLFNISHEITTWWAYIIACGWFSSFGIGLFATAGIFAYIGVMFFGFAIILIHFEFRFGRNKYRSAHRLRDNPSELFVNWRALELLIKVVNTEVMFCLLGFQNVVRNVVVFCICTLVYHWESLGFLVRVLFFLSPSVALTVWSVILILGGKLYSESEKTIQSWRGELCPIAFKWKYIQKAKLACKGFSIGDGKRYFLQPKSFLAFIKSVSRNTFKGLIAFANIFDLT